MDAYQILKEIHRVGHPLTGTVIGYETPKLINGKLIGGKILLDANLELKVVIPFYDFFDDYNEYDKNLLPKIGAHITTVIKNYVDGMLYVSAKKSDVSEEEICSFKAFYEFVDERKIGEKVTGIVKGVTSFGLFVEIENKHVGLIDIGHYSFNYGERLPVDRLAWPKEGDSINCLIAYFRFHNRQIGLGWLPKE
ncbi:S1 RNA-binding domain-containing protein [Chondrinema litorale]|uniref:S1 RNA-binding domain-containing protein n=1 Tax=Chondrinema litorale TaxID=2994555 RepID=UPI0025426E14|nr:S1 RNA-binding domain-containing protein [Chondrinema litorale]UZR99991.1 S1 RNA-binding domain-containing protein [Chondrinema litorale]